MSGPIKGSQEAKGVPFSFCLFCLLLLLFLLLLLDATEKKKWSKAGFRHVFQWTHRPLNFNQQLWTASSLTLPIPPLLFALMRFLSDEKEKKKKIRYGSQNVHVVQNKRQAKRKYQMLNTRRRGRFVKMKMLSTCHQVYIFGRLGNKKKEGKKEWTAQLPAKSAYLEPASGIWARPSGKFKSRTRRTKKHCCP